MRRESPWKLSAGFRNTSHEIKWKSDSFKEESSLKGWQVDISREWFSNNSLSSTTTFSYYKLDGETDDAMFITPRDIELSGYSLSQSLNYNLEGNQDLKPQLFIALAYGRSDYQRKRAYDSALWEQDFVDYSLGLGINALYRNIYEPYISYTLTNQSASGKTSFKNQDFSSEEFEIFDGEKISSLALGLGVRF